LTNLSFYSRKYFSHRDDVTRVSCLTAFRKYSKRLNADWLYNLILKCVQALGSLQPSVIKIRIRTYNDDDFVRGWTVTSWDILRNDFYLLKLGVYEISFILLSCMYTYIVYIHIYIYIYRFQSCTTWFFDTNEKCHSTPFRCTRLLRLLPRSSLEKLYVPIIFS